MEGFKEFEDAMIDITQIDPFWCKMDVIDTSGRSHCYQNHFGAMGTSKSTHYSVIWDENKFTSDEMQRLAYDLCYIFARCTKPVSLVTPVRYADLVAFRGRMFLEAAMEMESSEGFYNLQSNLKDSMFFI
ncbi:protein argonaute 2 [Artemisia annua]|uniref:Protein argonaute 2 n=1 Tax=Artemisia annua TaxID=35608 RepID=A0A2U1N0A0_ARTAN|nr:protein argonaute 2 [Artemisia annua]